MAETVVARTAKNSRLGFGTRMFMALGRALNPFLLPLAGTGLVPIWGVVGHRGRRSRRAYLTPVAVFATSEGFVIPLPFGDRTDWCRNLVAAGGGTMKWKGVEYTVTEPEIVDAVAALGAFPRVVRPLVRAFGITRVLRGPRRP